MARYNRIAIGACEGNQERKVSLRAATVETSRASRRLSRAATLPVRCILGLLAAICALDALPGCRATDACPKFAEMRQRFTDFGQIARVLAERGVDLAEVDSIR